MTKEELALRITRAMYKDRRNLESFNAYQAIKSYFSDLQTSDLIGIARQYGINLDSAEASNVSKPNENLINK